MTPSRNPGRILIVIGGFAILISACESKPRGTASTAPAASAGDAKPASHQHHPPHQGTLVEFGEELAHLELVLDRASGKLTAYVLDGEAEKSVRIVQAEIAIEARSVSSEFGKTPDEAVFVVTLASVGNPLTGEKAGDSSQFVATEARLKGVTEFDGVVLKIAIKGQEFAGVRFRFPEGH